MMKTDVKEDDEVMPIIASGKIDPGCRDLLNCVAKNKQEKGKETMDNLQEIPNDGIVTGTHDDYPVTKTLVKICCNYKIGNIKRNYVLVIEDMQYEYEDYVRYVIPNVKPLIDQFREKKLPIVWTNWSRRPEDGFYGALDRFYGPQGIAQEANPCYCYSKNANATVDELAPINDSEISRSIVSLHLSKFADLDDQGREILFPMLEAWGVNTIILCGAWTDDCIAATAFDAADKYGYDVILVNDGCATATNNGAHMMDCLYASTCCNMSSAEVVAHLNSHPELIEAPKAPLDGNVYLRPTPYRRDPIVSEVSRLRSKVAQLEAELARAKQQNKPTDEELRID